MIPSNMAYPIVVNWSGRRSSGRSDHGEALNSASQGICSKTNPKIEFGDAVRGIIAAATA
jgi:hypothetical protein